MIIKASNLSFVRTSINVIGRLPVPISLKELNRAICKDSEYKLQRHLASLQAAHRTSTRKIMV